MKTATITFQKPFQSQGQRYQDWLEAFGTFIDKNHGLKFELAQALKTSPQSIKRYFVDRTHELPARFFIEALEWQEKKRQNRFWYAPVPGASFGLWIFGSAEISKSGKGAA
jgi:hypothetical protein